MTLFLLRRGPARASPGSCSSCLLFAGAAALGAGACRPNGHPPQKVALRGGAPGPS